MYVKNLSLNNYRNYKDINIDFEKGFNVIYGENGHGKTNIIESIFICAAGKSHRTAHDIELIKKDEDSFVINMKFFNRIGDRKIEFKYNKNKEKSISVNDINIKKIGELIGKFNAVIFSPEDILIVKQNPSLRRRFIDITLSQIKPLYFYNLQQYNKTLNQRNSLLKQIKINKDYIETLEIWDKSIVSYGREIIKERENYVEELGKCINEIHYFLSGEKENIELKYIKSVEEEEYLIKLKQSINTDIQRETTAYGPHRDDILYLLNGESLKIYGSQGQQRTAVLSSKLAELEIMRSEIGEDPVLLLDDVLSELDINRQNFLFKKINEIQTFITCTDRGLIERMTGNKGSYFNIKNGNLIY